MATGDHVVYDLLVELADLAHQDWQRDALCAEPAYADVNFWPERGESVEPAREVCGRCLVQDECRRYALEQGITAGVWGATTGRARKVDPVRVERAKPRPHYCDGGCGRLLHGRARACGSTCRSRLQRGYQGGQAA